jgi:hypothetical protein
MGKRLIIATMGGILAAGFGFVLVYGILRVEINYHGTNLGRSCEMDPLTGGIFAGGESFLAVSGCTYVGSAVAVRPATQRAVILFSCPMTFLIAFLIGLSQFSNITGEEVWQMAPTQISLKDSFRQGKAVSAGLPTGLACSGITGTSLALYFKQNTPSKSVRQADKKERQRKR